MARRVALALVVLLTGVARAEPAFMDWVNAASGRRAEVVAFERYLEHAHVDGVLTTDLLLRNASSWEACGLSYPYSMPPQTLWPHVVTTIKFIRDEIVPAIGLVTVESGYREPILNKCAHGAPQSAHALYYALDLIPECTTSRHDLIATICKLHARRGKAYNVGLGFYDGLRFHIDTKAYRRWGSDNHGKTSPCATITG